MLGNIDRGDIERIVDSVLSQYGTGTCGSEITVGRIPAEVSAKHIHLDKYALEQLFGVGYTLKPKRDLSQPGQFLSEERVKLVTAKGVIDNVAVLGPLRDHVQVELSATDARELGVNPPLRLSGDLRDAADVIIVGPKGICDARNSAIIAKAHVHMTGKDAASFGVSDGEHVRVRLEGQRPVTFDDVIVRVTEKSSLALHIDYDEANAALFSSGSAVIIGKENRTQPVQSASRPEAADSVAAKALPCSGKKLITEECAREMVAQGIIEPGKGSIVTPAAKDIFIAAGRGTVVKR